MRVVVFVAAAGLLCGCYVPVPVGSPAPQPGSQVHVQLTDSGSVQLARYIGRGVTGVDGTLMQRSDTGYLVAVKHTVLASGDEQPWSGENVELPMPAVASVRQKKLSFWRSSVLAGAILGAAFAIRFGTAGGTPGGTSSGGPKGTK